MGKLIDADALLDRIPNLYERREVSRWVDDAPTVDAVPVVRCKDCKWFEDANDECGTCGFFEEARSAAHYCGEGVQKDGVNG